MDSVSSHPTYEDLLAGKSDDEWDNADDESFSGAGDLNETQLQEEVKRAQAEPAWRPTPPKRETYVAPPTPQTASEQISFGARAIEGLEEEEEEEQEKDENAAEAKQGKGDTHGDQPDDTSVQQQQQQQKEKEQKEKEGGDAQGDSDGGVTAAVVAPRRAPQKTILQKQLDAMKDVSTLFGGCVCVCVGGGGERR